MAECKKLPETGPVEITIAIVIILGILGAGFYFYRTKKMLKAANDNAMGKDNNSDNSNNNNA